MSDQTKIQTAGPADPDAKRRELVNYIGFLLTGVLGLALIFGAINQGTADHLELLIGGVLGLAGGGNQLRTALKIRQQVNNGTFDPAPAVSVQDAFHSINAIKTHVDDVVEQVQAKVSEGVSAIQGAASLIPGGTVATTAVLSGPVGDLVQAYADRAAAHEGSTPTIL